MTDYARLYALRSCPTHLQACRRWEELEHLLTAVSFLEAKVQAGMIFQLVADFAAAGAIPAERPQQPIVALLGSALGRDAHFIAQHVQDYPQALFQCLWNSCWWYDCPDVLMHYAPRNAGSASEALPSTQTALKLCELLQRWRNAKNASSPGFPWTRFLRPPAAGPSSRLVAQLTGHVGAVNGVTFATNGQHVLSSAADGTVRIWDSRSTTELRCIHGHAGAVIAAAFSPDGRLLASGSSDGTIRLCAIENAEELVCLHGHTNTVKALAFSSDGQHILSGSADRTVRRWNVGERKQTQCFFWHSSDVSSVSTSFDDQRIASGAQDGQLVVWDGKCLLRLRGHTSGVACLAFSPDGRRLVSGSWDGTIRLWDCESGAELKCLCGHRPLGFWCVLLRSRAPHCQLRHDATVRVWDANTGAELDCFRGHSGTVSTVAFSPDERHLASGSAEGKVCLWTLDGRSEGVASPAHSSPITRIAFSADGRLVVSSSLDGDLLLWDATTGSKLREFVGHNRAVSVLAFSPDAGRIMSVAGDLTVRTWSVADGSQVSCLDDRYIDTQRVIISPDGQRVIRIGRYWDEIWDIERNTRRFSGHSLVVSPDGRHVICGKAGSIELRDARTGGLIRTLPDEYGSFVGFSALSPDCSRVVGVSRSDCVVRLWDTANGELRRTFRLERDHRWGWLKHVRISDDGGWMLATVESRSYDTEHQRFVDSAKIIVWNAETGETAAIIFDKAAVVRFVDDNRRIICIDNNGYRLWSIAEGNCLAKIEGQLDVAGLRHEAMSIPQIVVWQGEYGTIIETRTGAVAARIPHRLAPVVLHPNGNGWAGAVGNHVEIATLERG